MRGRDAFCFVFVARARSGADEGRDVDAPDGNDWRFGNLKFETTLAYACSRGGVKYSCGGVAAAAL